MAGWNPADYHQSSAMQRRLADEILARLDFGPTEAVLDVGCGDGKITAAIAARVPEGRAVGVDAAAEMIAFATDEFPPDRYPNLRFAVMDAADLRFAAEFDRIVSFACLHWVPDHAAVLAGMARALRGGGRLFFQCGGRGNVDAVQPAVDAAVADPRWHDRFAGFTAPYRFYGPERYEELARQAGLVLERAELIPKDTTHQGIDGFEAWFRTTWHPYTNRVPEPDRPAFVEAVVSRYTASHPPDAEGRVHVPMVRLEVEARKP